MPRGVRTDPEFPISAVLARVARAVAGIPPPSMFQLAAEGRTTLFEQVVSCVVSVRTREEISLVAARRLFRLGTTPAEIAACDVGRIDRAIDASTFHEQKAPRILEIARIAERDHGGVLPCEEEVLRSLPGVGPKCAHLALGIACGTPAIPVDIHVHRVVNRWGYVVAKTPEQTMNGLELVLPRRYWLEINRLLVPFGREFCTGTLPRCSACPVRANCARLGVVDSR